MKKITYLGFLIVLIFQPSLMDAQQTDSGLILTSKGVHDIKQHSGRVPLFDASLKSVREEVDREIALGIEVPIPEDMAGGYTHERHKKNFFTAQKAGVLFQITGEKEYAQYVRQMLLEYAAMYPDLPLHPEERSYARGRIFWQALNDANWLVYMSQAYAGIQDYINAKERKKLEQDLFRPFADFLSVGNPQFFNRIHNHSTWGNAAVGMVGLVIGDDELVQRALFGLETDNIEERARDDDGGFIKQPGQDAGFIANMNEAFSPSGYYTEGPYYQRYAMYPFMVFAAALENKKPELQIFQYKDQVLVKAVNTLLNLSDADGEFFPINDAQKGMSYRSRELITAVGMAYHFGGQDKRLLSIAKEQGRVSIDDTGLAMALAISKDKAKPFIKKSMEFTDGPKGEKGAVSVLRSTVGFDPFSLLFKYASQGDSHGHYDRLSYSLYRGGEEIVQDYGLVRFVNIDQKNGGGYLNENKTWAKQTIAHNTIVQNETSHFGGDFEIGTEHPSQGYFLDFSRKNVQIVSAKENNAYPGTKMQRTLVMSKSPETSHSLVVDVFKVKASKKNQYDLPLYYKGQVISHNAELEVPDQLEKLGRANGYEHLWKEATGKTQEPVIRFTWLDKNKFYSMTSVTGKGDSVIFAGIGATDPEFNLRRDPVLILRKQEVEDALFVSVLEAHGSYNPVTEMSANAFSTVQGIEVVHDGEAYTAVEIALEKEKVFLIISNQDAKAEAEHNLKIGQQEYSWKGPYYFNNLKN